MAKKIKNLGGRPPHEVTPANKAMVELLAASGLTQLEIARKMEIAPMTLFKYYQSEIENGWASVMEIATAVIVKEMKEDGDKALDAAKFFLSRRGRGLWSEVKQMEVSGPNGGAIPVQRFDLTQLPPEELDQLESYIDAIVIGEDQDDD